MNWYLETPRMKLRELSKNDENVVWNLDSDPEVMRYLTEGKPSTPLEIQVALEKTEQLLKKHNGRFGFWAAIHKENEKFMGWFHFRPSKQEPENLKRIELGYRLKQEFWGQGYATEGSKHLIAKGFRKLGIEEVFAVTMKKNIASRRVMEKAGLKFHREFYSPEYPSTKQLDVEYLLQKSAWLNSNK